MLNTGISSWHFIQDFTKSRGRFNKLLFFTHTKSFFKNKGQDVLSQQSFYLHFAVYLPSFPIVFPFKSFPYAFHKVETAQTLLTNKCGSLSLFFWHRFLGKDAILLFKSNLNCFVSTLRDVFMLRALSQNVYWKTCNKQRWKCLFRINIFVSHPRS